MRRVLARTWFPATLFGFAALVAMLAVMVRGSIEGDEWMGEAVEAVVIAAISAFIAVPIWWRVVARRSRPALGRGAFAGGLWGGAIPVGMILFAIGGLVWRHLIRGQPWDDGEVNMLPMGFAILVMAVPWAAGFGAVVGTAVALVTIWVEGRGRSGAEE
jgi:hypothetical protein